MAKTIVSCGFSQTEIDTIDNLVKKGYFASRSDAIRTCTNECLVRSLNLRFVVLQRCNHTDC